MYKLEKEKLILTDVDGVLVDWNNAFSSFMAERGHSLLPGGETAYSLSDRHGISVKEAARFVKEFNESDRISNLKDFADAKMYIQKLYQNGFKFIAITSLSNNPVVYNNRSSNLLNLFGNVFDEINCIAQGASKVEILGRWKDTGYFWIEDHKSNAEAGHAVGLKPILINHPYNNNYSADLFPKVSYDTPWKDIYLMIETEYNL